jgi:hypothetical protein
MFGGSLITFYFVKDWLWQKMQYIS